MAKLYSHTDLLTKHGELRKVVSQISKETTAVRKQANKYREDAEKLYSHIKSKTQRNNMIKQHVEAKLQAVTEPVKDKVLPLIKEMEGHRLELAEAAEIMTNPISYCNAVTFGSSKLFAQRAAASQLIAGMGSAAMRVAAEAAKTSGDIGLLAALVDRNDQLPADARPFSNAELMSDVNLPGFDDVQAVFQEVSTLPEYAMACSRALDKGGDISPSDRIRIGLSENKLNILEDGSLADFQTTEPPRYKIDGTELIQPDKPKSGDLNPADYKSSVEYVEAGGSMLDDIPTDVLADWANNSAEDAA